MMLKESLRTGAVEIWSNKLRSFLSLTAIMFGVAAILYTFANVNRMYQKRMQAFELAGPGRMEITTKSIKGEDTPGLSKGLTFADAEAIREAMPELYMVSPLQRTNDPFRYESFEDQVSVEGVTPEWRKRNWVFKLKGRFFDEDDLRSAARVCLLNEPGGWAGEKPFWARWWKDGPFEEFVKHHDMVGRTVKIKDQLFTVIGILENPPKDKDPRWFRYNVSSVYVPLTTMQRYLSTAQRGGSAVPDSVSDIHVDTGSEATIEAAKRRIESILTARHRGVVDFEVEDYREMIQNVLNRMREQAIAVLSVGIVAILAGGVGIMNVTLATIFSRIREIGVRRAIGATRTDILFQFIIEAMMLGFIGGVAGTGLGLVGLNYITEEGPEVVASLLWWHFLATLAISIGAGFVFSLYPAYQASKLDPVEALRYE